MLSRSIRVSRFVFIAVLLIACSCGDNRDPDAESEEIGAIGVEDSYTVRFGPYEVPPGTESTKCVIRRIGNEAQIHVGAISNVLGRVSHHFIVYRLNEGEERPEPFDCDPFVGTLNPNEGAPLMITQKAEETLTLPDGVGFSLEPGQLVRLELHYVNATNEPQSVSATSTFKTMSDSEFIQEADFLFVGNPDISLPLGSSSLTTDYMPIPEELVGVKIFGITGHTHKWGTDVAVAIREGEVGPLTSLYEVETFNWDEPETKRLTPPIEVGENAGFQFRCAWNNDSGREVQFGESVDDEMCFFWAYYYPSRGSKVCIHSEQGAGLGVTDLCCPGEALCPFLEEFFK